MNDIFLLRGVCLTVFYLMVASFVQAQLVIPDEFPQEDPSKKQVQYEQPMKRGHAESFPSAVVSPEVEGQIPSEGLVIQCPKQARVGVPVSIVVEAKNHSRSSKAGTISISFGGLEPRLCQESDSFDWLPANSGKKAALFEKQDDVWFFQNKTTRVSNTLVELYESSWEPEAAQRLSFSVIFNKTGVARLLIRASFATKSGKVTTITDNAPAVGPIDQQGLPCIVFEIVVE